jgi:hypothetical protein
MTPLTPVRKVLAFLADAALGEGNVLGDARVEVMGDHHHVEGFSGRVQVRC